MGKGDKKSKRGKISMGSHGKLRPKKKNAAAVATTVKPKVKKEVAPPKEAEPKPAAPKKAAAAEKPAAEKKPAAKKATKAKEE